MIGNRQQIARLQSDFYRDCYYRMIKWLLTSIVIILGLIVAIIYFLLFTHPSHYYASTTVGQIITMAQDH